MLLFVLRESVLPEGLSIKPLRDFSMTRHCHRVTDDTLAESCYYGKGTYRLLGDVLGEVEVMRDAERALPTRWSAPELKDLKMGDVKLQMEIVPSSISSPIRRCTSRLPLRIQS